MMRRIVIATVLLFSGAMPTLGADLPPRKLGLWEIHIYGVVLKNCIDAATDKLMMAPAGPIPEALCPKPTVERSGDTWTLDYVCPPNGTSHTVIKGSLDSAYTMTVTTEGASDGKLINTTTAKWLGPCAADQKPGDVISPHGKVNIVDRAKKELEDIPPLPPLR